VQQRAEWRLGRRLGHCAISQDSKCSCNRFPKIRRCSGQGISIVIIFIFDTITVFITIIVIITILATITIKATIVGWTATFVKQLRSAMSISEAIMAGAIPQRITMVTSCIKICTPPTWESSLL
jgi:hypothetical protein